MHNQGNIATEGNPNSGLYSYRIESQHCTPQSFGQIEALYMHSLYENHPTGPGLEACVFRATNTGLNESLGPASGLRQTQNICITFVQRRLRRWADAVQMSYKSFVFAGLSSQSGSPLIFMILYVQIIFSITHFMRRSPAVLTFVVNFIGFRLTVLLLGWL